MKKISYLMVMLIATVLSFSSCSDNDSPENTLNQLTVQLSSDETSVDFSNFTVTLTEQRSGQNYYAKASSDGKATFAVPLGQYDVVAEDSINGGVTMYGSMSNYTLSATSTLNIKVTSVLDNMDKTFELNELGFNCSSNRAWQYNMYEEYFTFTNVSNRPLYADGLSIGICGDYNSLEGPTDKSVLLPDTIVASQVYTIPGNGREHLVQPGQSIVIAHSAIDHTNNDSLPKALNLTGADFEIYVPSEWGSMTTDNPEVPNLIVNFTTFQAFQWNAGGVAPIFLFRIKGDANKFIAGHTAQFTVSGGFGNRKQDYVKVPASWVIDGVETGTTDQHLRNVLPESVDRGVILGDFGGMYGGYNGYLVQRKPAATGYLQDTNNSAYDFVVVPNGLKSYKK